MHFRSTGGNAKPSVSTSNDAASNQIHTTVTPNATVNGSSAVSNVTTAEAKELIDQAVRNDSSAVVIAPNITGSVTTTKVTISGSAVGEIGSKTDADLKINTPVANVTIPNQALGGLSGGGTLSVTVDRQGDTLAVTIRTGNTVAASVSGGVTVETTVQQGTLGTVAVLVAEDGTRQVVRKSMVNMQNGTITIPLQGSARVELVDNSKSFSDVSNSSWAADAVSFVSSRELFNGTGSQTFSPNLSMTRGMLTVVLHNLESNPGSAVLPSFSDVQESWYSEAVVWAAEKGIVNGYPDNTFGPDDPITREQLAVVLWNYAGKPTSGQTGGERSFKDTDQISGYARTAMEWAISSRILNGDGDGHLNPTMQATRAQVAQMLLNFMRGNGG